MTRTERLMKQPPHRRFHEDSPVVERAWPWRRRVAELSKGKGTRGFTRKQRGIHA